MDQLPSDVLDDILATQILVAWAGEGRCEPSRLDWWSTDLVDEFGGGDFFRRLLPRTHRWAALEAVREAARRQDAKIRSQAADPDKQRSLFHLGHEVDRQLDERLAAHKTEAGEPSEAMPLLRLLDDEFDRDQLAATLREAGKVKFEETPGGRRVPGDMPDDLREAARTLGAALVPFADRYPQPHYHLR
ncbi:MAG: BREX-6 system BrxE protein [Persicimonas sp.]